MFFLLIIHFKWINLRVSCSKKQIRHIRIESHDSCYTLQSIEFSVIESIYLEARFEVLLPFVSAIVVMRNEEKYISQILTSLLAQDYPADCYEILIVDGLSDDRSLELAQETVSKYRQNNSHITPNIYFYQNPEKSLAAGWNIGIKKSSGTYVVRIDAHAMVFEDFISKSVEVMQQNPQATCVGGKMISKPSSSRGELIAMALSSPFGVGNSRFRIDGDAGAVDTVAFGLYRKDIFDKVGLFNTKLQRNQDNDMHARIRDAGGVFWFDPKIQSVYFTRGTVKGMMTQAFGNGKWNAVLLKSHPAALSLRHLVPFAFVISLIIQLMLAFFYSLFLYSLIVTLVLHLLVGLYFAFKKTKRILGVLMLYGLFFLLHSSYGIGTMFGLFLPSPIGEDLHVS